MLGRTIISLASRCQRPLPRQTLVEERCFNSSSAATQFEESRTKATHNWFNQVVIGERLCPFAPPMEKNPHLLRVVCAPLGSTPQHALELVTNQVQELIGASGSKEKASPQPTHETTLVIMDLPFLHDFRDFVRFSWDLQELAVGEENVGKLQLVLFHPLATHQTYGMLNEDNPADYTIRSPYPTVHLLREIDVMKAVQGGYPNLETLPQRNQAKLMKRGLEFCRKLLEDCYVDRELTALDETRGG